MTQSSEAEKIFGTFDLLSSTCCFWILGCLSSLAHILLCRSSQVINIGPNGEKKKKLARKTAQHAG